ncbi:uncharacterized protein MONBRDRAFT_28769 [Monosiga brevicollis MX1]|uniref:BTB domain-containing protein n=1 Tax=Monosiga brevicollis TaxID=81824 RepID=A9V950_MONBE|nr:uncharacterized protein MONBRDRAFT_28769 [Monosiga brevicollis MX1]EDQ85994.1 predicted protein [Monosiga brevicollis MX1]|eukprot:XP_001749188.1 hypothetical protein [Monosiga brevicollis MX1]
MTDARGLPLPKRRLAARQLQTAPATNLPSPSVQAALSLAGSLPSSPARASASLPKPRRQSHAADPPAQLSAPAAPAAATVEPMPSAPMPSAPLLHDRDPRPADPPSGNLTGLKEPAPATVLEEQVAPVVASPQTTPGSETNVSPDTSVAAPSVADPQATAHTDRAPSRPPVPSRSPSQQLRTSPTPAQDPAPAETPATAPASSPVRPKPPNRPMPPNRPPSASKPAPPQRPPAPALNDPPAPVAAPRRPPRPTGPSPGPKVTPTPASRPSRPPQPTASAPASISKPAPPSADVPDTRQPEVAPETLPSPRRPVQVPSRPQPSPKRRTPPPRPTGPSRTPSSTSVTSPVVLVEHQAPDQPDLVELDDDAFEDFVGDFGAESDSDTNEYHPDQDIVSAQKDDSGNQPQTPGDGGAPSTKVNELSSGLSPTPSEPTDCTSLRADEYLEIDGADAHSPASESTATGVLAEPTLMPGTAPTLQVASPPSPPPLPVPLTLASATPEDRVPSAVASQAAAATALSPPATSVCSSDQNAIPVSPPLPPAPAIASASEMVESDGPHLPQARAQLLQEIAQGSGRLRRVVPSESAEQARPKTFDDDLRAAMASVRKKASLERLPLPADALSASIIAPFKDTLNMIMPIAWQKLSEGMHALDNVFVNKFDRDAMVEIAFNRTQAFLLLCQLLEQRLNDPTWLGSDAYTEAQEHLARLREQHGQVIAVRQREGAWDQQESPSLRQAEPQPDRRDPNLQAAVNALQNFQGNTDDLRAVLAPLATRQASGQLRKLMRAALESGKPLALETLLTSQAWPSVDVHPLRDMHVLAEVVAIGADFAVPILVQHGVDVNAASHDTATTAMHLAARNNSRRLLARHFRVAQTNGLAQADIQASDVTVRGQGEGPGLPAHRIVLCARSQYFRGMLDSQVFLEARQPEIVLHDIPTPVLKLILKYIYTGDMAFNTDQIQLAVDCLMACREFQLPQFFNAIQKKLVGSVDLQTCISLVEAAILCHAPVLLASAMRTFLEHYDQLQAGQDPDGAFLQQFLLGITDEHLKVPDTHRDENVNGFFDSGH